MVTHFTHTGEMAGLPYCGIERNETDKFMHLNLGYITKHRQDICRKCLMVYENCGICKNQDCDSCPINELRPTRASSGIAKKS